MKRMAQWAYVAAAATVLASAAQAGSIWAKGQARTRQIYADDTAKGVGDVVTILIEEQAKIENETTRKMDKSGSRNAKSGGTFDFGNLVSFLDGHMFKVFNTDVAGTSSNKFDGKAEFDSDRKVTDKVTATVEDVLPNGNLVVLGKRERGVAGDRQIIQVSGIIRPSDVAFDNSVSSKKVAEFKLLYLSVGQENHFTNPGWFSRLLNFLNPN